jgi:glucokinase
VTDPLIPVLEVGGSHASAALVDTDAGAFVGPAHRHDVDGAAPAADIIDSIVGAAGAVPVSDARPWGIAIPGPFDYARGIARFDGVGKFESLRGLDLRAILSARLPGQPHPHQIVFLNDADAFALGEWAHGAAAGSRRCVGLTLGTGVGSGWIVDGHAVAAGPGVPPDGRADRLEIDGAPLEDTVSTRAIRRAYRSATGDAGCDVRAIAARAREGERPAREVLAHSMQALGRALGPYLRDFGADIVVVGGSMTRSWDLFGPWFHSGFADVGPPPPIRLADDPGRAPLLGAARFARDAALEANSLKRCRSGSEGAPTA